LTKFKYSMGTMHAITPSIKTLGLVAGQIYIRRAQEYHNIYVYNVTGGGGGLALGISAFQWTSSENTFESGQSDPARFGGRVYMTDAGDIQFVAIGYSLSQTCTWTDGPAAGTQCTGGGWALGLAVGITAFTGQICFLRYSHIQSVPSSRTFAFVKQANVPRSGPR
jgi:hypothetical protein